MGSLAYTCKARKPAVRRPGLNTEGREEEKEGENTTLGKLHKVSKGTA